MLFILGLSLASGVMAGDAFRLQKTVKILAEVHNAPQKNSARSKKLAELFQQNSSSAGIIHRQIFHYNNRKAQNVWITLPATGIDRGIFIIGAHTDTTPRGSAGVVDNWSSCVMLAALYERLQVEEREHTFLFIGFSGEEHGQQGSQAFLRKMRWATRSRVRAMINLECLGVGRVRSWSNRSADDLETIFQDAAGELGIPAPRQVLFGFRADSISFQRAGIPAMTLHSLSRPMLSVINTPVDDGSQINDSRYLETFKLLTRFLIKLDRHQGLLTPTDREARLRPAITALRGEPAPGTAAGESGVRLAGLPPQSREYRAGLREGDLLTAIDGAPIKTPRELEQILLTIARGSEVEMVVNPTANDRKVVMVEY